MYVYACIFAYGYIFIHVWTERERHTEKQIPHVARNLSMCGRNLLVRHVNAIHFGNKLRSSDMEEWIRAERGEDLPTIQ